MFGEIVDTAQTVDRRWDEFPSVIITNYRQINPISHQQSYDSLNAYYYFLKIIYLYVFIYVYIFFTSDNL